MSSLKEIQALQLQSEKVFDYFEEIFKRCNSRIDCH